MLTSRDGSAQCIACGRFPRESQEKLRVSDEVVEKMLEDLEHGIQQGDTQDLRAFLHRFVKRIEIDREGGRVLCIFPFASAVL